MKSDGTCSICREIPDYLRANTGRGDNLPASTHPLVHYKDHYDAIGTSTDLWECPECTRFYIYTTETAYTGSGNNDEDTLTKLPHAQSEALHAMCAARGDVTELEEPVFAMPLVALEAALWGAYHRSRELVARFIPRLVHEYAKQGQISYSAHPTRDVLYGLIQNRPSFAREVLAATATLPPELRARLGDLEDRCKKAMP